MFPFVTKEYSVSIVSELAEDFHRDSAQRFPTRNMVKIFLLSFSRFSDSDETVVFDSLNTSIRQTFATHKNYGSNLDDHVAEAVQETSNSTKK